MRILRNRKIAPSGIAGGRGRAVDSTVIGHASFCGQKTHRTGLA